MRLWWTSLIRRSQVIVRLGTDMSSSKERKLSRVCLSSGGRREIFFFDFEKINSDLTFENLI